MTCLKDAEIAALREALRPFADRGERLRTANPSWRWFLFLFNKAELEQAALAMTPPLTEEIATASDTEEMQTYRSAIQREMRNYRGMRGMESIYERLRRVVGVSGPEEEMITRHIMTGTTLTFEYVNHRRVSAIRRVAPSRLWFGATKYHPDPQRFLTGFDVERKDYRDFALRDARFDL